MTSTPPTTHHLDHLDHDEAREVDRQQLRETIHAVHAALDTTLGRDWRNTDADAGAAITRLAQRSGPATTPTTAASPVVPHDALHAARIAFTATDTQGGPLSTDERLRAAVIAATPHILDANPDTDAYQRGYTDGIGEATQLIEATP